MNVTEVRIKLMNDPHERLLAFCSVTFDGSFVIRDLKIIQGTKGAFVAMPSRKLTDHCPRCHGKNHLRARFCNECGAHMDENRAQGHADNGRAKLYADVAHPIHSDCRETIQDSILAEYEQELVRATAEDYICTYDDYGEDRVATLVGEEETAIDTRTEPRETVPTSRTLPSSDDRRFRIDMPETPHRPSVARDTNPQKVANRSQEDGFGDGLV